MSWREKLRPASFKGASFFIQDSSRSGGRRIAKHEFPDRDIPFSQDLGRKARAFSVEGIVLGDDYFEKKDALIAACEDSGAGELIHPYHSSRRVICETFQIREAIGEGGSARFSFSFVEEGLAVFPQSAFDQSFLARKAADASHLIAQSDFASSFDVLGLPQFAIDSARQAVSLAADAFEEVTAAIPEVSDTIADIAFSLRNLKAEIVDLVTAPRQLAERLASSIGLLSTVSLDPKAILKEAMALSSFGSSLTPIEETTATRIKEAQNQRVVIELVQRVSVAESVALAARSDFSSVEEALENQAVIVSSIDEILESTRNDKVFVSFQSLRTELIKSVPQPNKSLPRIKKVHLLDTTPSLVAAYDIYGNLDFEQDIIDRNSITHPGFISPLKPLEVLIG